jgi:hypothetical protein
MVVPQHRRLMVSQVVHPQLLDQQLRVDMAGLTETQMETEEALEQDILEEHLRPDKVTEPVEALAQMEMDHLILEQAEAQVEVGRQ